MVNIEKELKKNTNIAKAVNLVKRKGGGIENTTHKKLYVVITPEDLKNLELNERTTTSKEINEFVRNKLDLPIKIRTERSYSKQITPEMLKKLGLKEDATRKEVNKAMAEFIAKH